VQKKAIIAEWNRGGTLGKRRDRAAGRKPKIGIPNSNLLFWGGRGDGVKERVIRADVTYDWGRREI